MFSENTLLTTTSAIVWSRNGNRSPSPTTDANSPPLLGRQLHFSSSLLKLNFTYVEIYIYFITLNFFLAKNRRRIKTPANLKNNPLGDAASLGLGIRFLTMGSLLRHIELCIQPCNGDLQHRGKGSPEEVREKRAAVVGGGRKGRSKTGQVGASSVRQVT